MKVRLTQHFMFYPIFYQLIINVEKVGFEVLRQCVCKVFQISHILNKIY